MLMVLIVPTITHAANWRVTMVTDVVLCLELFVVKMVCTVVLPTMHAIAMELVLTILVK